MQKPVIKKIATLEKQLFNQEAWSLTTIEDWLQLEFNQLLTVFEHEILMGYCLYQSIFENAEILRIGVAPDFQRHGIAQQLLNTVVAQLRQQSVDNLFLEVREDNLAARALYQKLGFEQIDIRKHYYKNTDGSRCHALILNLNLKKA